MKVRSATVLTGIFLLQLASGQVPAQPQRWVRIPFPANTRPLTGEEWRYQLVERLLTLPSPVRIGAVQLHGMGDEAATDVLKILSQKGSFSSAEIQSALDIIHMAFEQPTSIMESAHSRPLVAMFLLQYLGPSNSDPYLKQRLENEATFLHGTDQAAISALAAK